MRRVVVLAVLAIALPTLVWANGIDIVNKNGVITISNAGLITSNSHLIQFNQHIAPQGNGFGFVNFGTGALNSGSIFCSTVGTCGTFSDSGSFFNVTGTGGFKGVPKGPIFTGNFVGDVLWNLVSQSGNGCPTAPCTYSFQLIGNISGQLYTGNTVSGNTVQNITAFYGQWLRDGKGDVHLGGTHINTPEPGTLGLLGIGLVSMAGVVRRKLNA